MTVRFQLMWEDELIFMGEIKIEKQKCIFFQSDS